MNKPLLSAATAAFIAFSTSAFANEAELERRLQKLEEAIARIEARLAKVESARSDNRRGGMMGGGGMMDGGGMMGGARPNEQWRKPEAKK
jgi:uncharacterized membrane protein